MCDLTVAYPDAKRLRTPAEVLHLGDAVPACNGIAFTDEGFTISFDVTAPSAFDASSNAIDVASKLLIDDLEQMNITKLNVARSDMNLSVAWNISPPINLLVLSLVAGS